VEDIVVQLQSNFYPHKNQKVLRVAVVFPFVLFLFLIAGFSNEAARKSNTFNSAISEINQTPDSSTFRFKYNILSEDDLSAKIKDTVYTKLDSWLELRIDQQMLYQHWRDGRIYRYPVSTGNKYLSRSTDSKPGLFVIFYKNAHHMSSQYNNADMYHFMPFNQGIGFHSMNGTGYYAALGKMPSSHGCIRMRHDDVRKIFNDSPIGTIVLAHNGYTARTVGFAPEDFEDTVQYTKEEIKYRLAKNLHNILTGNYYTKERYYIVLDPKIVPSSGIYISYNKKIPPKQNLPRTKYTLRYIMNDRISDKSLLYINTGLISSDTSFIEGTTVEGNNLTVTESDIEYSNEELINKYFKNPVGILPYYGPTK